MFGTTHNCIHAYTDVLWDKSWFEYDCLEPSGRSCPCSYPAQPILRLRGLCKDTPLDRYFSPKQLPGNPGNMILVGLYSAKIEFNDASSQWILTDAKYNVTAMSRATKLSYLLGKHYWTISYEKLECSGGKPQTIYLKLTGCKEGEFTCDDGQCIKMERRCDQVTGKPPNCRDESDENGCQLLVLENNYNNKTKLG